MDWKRLNVLLANDGHLRVGLRKPEAAGKPRANQQHVGLIGTLRIGLQRHPEVGRWAWNEAR